MSAIAEVKLWGSTIGAVVLNDGEQAASFQYDPEFAQSGIEVSPVMMPLASRVYAFPGLAAGSFHGLPGLLADSLPDRFGTALIEEWLARQGRRPESFNAIERLCYTGSRGMGALEYVPASGPAPGPDQPLQVERLAALASEVLRNRDNLRATLAEADRAETMQEILRVGTSAGGARAKAVIAWNPETNEIRSGQVKAPKGFGYWLLKFDGVDGNRDKELADPLGYGAIEYAYYKMAREGGITMSDCRLLEEGGRRHFMTRRFDRLPDGGKLHLQSLGAMAHYDYNQAGAHGYEQAFAVIRRLGLSVDETVELFRRMVFNVVARNQDDHVKNIAFLMDRSGHWSLAPAYDMTYSYQPGGRWTACHQMTINGKRDDFTREDFEACARGTPVKPRQVRALLEEIKGVIKRWPEYAEEAGVNPVHRDLIHKTLRL